VQGVGGNEERYMQKQLAIENEFLEKNQSRKMRT
jgi:hypothetical protein